MAKVDSDRFLFCFEFSGRGTGWKKWDHLAGKYKLELKKKVGKWSVIKISKGRIV